MSNTTLSYQQMGTTARSQTHTLFAPTMGYVAARSPGALGRNLAGVAAL